MSESALGAKLGVIDLQKSRSSDHPTCIALEGTEGIGGAMAFEVVPTVAGRLHSDQYTKIIIINTPINLRVFPWYQLYTCSRYQQVHVAMQLLSNRLRKASISHETFGLPGVYVQRGLRQYVYFQSIFIIQNFHNSESAFHRYMCIFSQFSEVPVACF